MTSQFKGLDTNTTKQVHCCRYPDDSSFLLRWWNSEGVQIPQFQGHIWQINMVYYLNTTLVHCWHNANSFDTKLTQLLTEVLTKNVDKNVDRNVDTSVDRMLTQVLTQVSTQPMKCWQKCWHKCRQKCWHKCIHCVTVTTQPPWYSIRIQSIAAGQLEETAPLELLPPSEKQNKSGIAVSVRDFPPGYVSSSSSSSSSWCLSIGS